MTGNRLQHYSGAANDGARSNREISVKETGTQAQFAINIIQEIWPNGSWTDIRRQQIAKIVTAKYRAQLGCEKETISIERVKEAVRY